MRLEIRSSLLSYRFTFSPFVMACSEETLRSWEIAKTVAAERACRVSVRLDTPTAAWLDHERRMLESSAPARRRHAKRGRLATLMLENTDGFPPLTVMEEYKSTKATLEKLCHLMAIKHNVSPETCTPEGIMDVLGIREDDSSEETRVCVVLACILMSAESLDRR